MQMTSSAHDMLPSNFSVNSVFVPFPGKLKSQSPNPDLGSSAAQRLFLAALHLFAPLVSCCAAFLQVDRGRSWRSWYSAYDADRGGCIAVLVVRKGSLDKGRILARQTVHRRLAFTLLSRPLLPKSSPMDMLSYCFHMPSTYFAILHKSLVQRSCRDVGCKWFCRISQHPLYVENPHVASWPGEFFPHIFIHGCNVICGIILLPWDSTDASPIYP